MRSGSSKRIAQLKEKMLSEPRFASIEQAKIITDSYREHENEPRILQRAYSLRAALEKLQIRIEPGELIVGNRTAGVRYGVVFPESGSSWVDREFETLPTRPQDRFQVRQEDIQYFREEIKPYWKGKSLEDVLKQEYGKEIAEISKVVKINQQDHAQGHICPNCALWLQKGPEGLRLEAEKRMRDADDEKQVFYKSVQIVMEGVSRFMLRYAREMRQMERAEKDDLRRQEMETVALNCERLAKFPAGSFHEAVQSIWFLMVVLHMESNASSFSPGRLDRILYPYYQADVKKGLIDEDAALEIVECLWLKFNEIVYMRNAHSAKYFAGFPIGFNIAVGGCVELTTQGNNLGWSDSAMFNLNKVLELTMTGGKDLLSGEQIGEDYGSLLTYKTFEELEEAFKKQLDYFMDKMIPACEAVEKAHIALLPTPFLSAVINDCMETGTDVTAGGAHYNFSGIQMIQVANLADSMAALKKMVYEEGSIAAADLLNALERNFEGYEIIRTKLLNKVPKYGNDVAWVDELGTKWAEYFKKRLGKFTNYRGGKYHTGMYTVSDHVPMGENVGASPDGRYAGTPLADGGMSPVYGRDIAGPTAVLKSVSRLDKTLTSNGGLLNMKFLPAFFKNQTGIDKFALFLRSFVDLEIPHIQFNVVNREDLIAAKKNPEQYRSLTVRVAGYTAYFTELAGELQDEIIARTSYGDI